MVRDVQETPRPAIGRGIAIPPGLVRRAWPRGRAAGRVWAGIGSVCGGDGSVKHHQRWPLHGKGRQSPLWGWFGSKRRWSGGGFALGSRPALVADASEHPLAHFRRRRASAEGLFGRGGRL